TRVPGALDGLRSRTRNGLPRPTVDPVTRIRSSGSQMRILPPRTRLSSCMHLITIKAELKAPLRDLYMLGIDKKPREGADDRPRSDGYARAFLDIEAGVAFARCHCDWPLYLQGLVKVWRKQNGVRTDHLRIAMPKQG
ncbi:hypothetical protein MUK42_33902, partial [Musa troglodytarum]